MPSPTNQLKSCLIFPVTFIFTWNLSCQRMKSLWHPGYVWDYLGLKYCHKYLLRSAPSDPTNSPLVPMMPRILLPGGAFRWYSSPPTPPIHMLDFWLVWSLMASIHPPALTSIAVMYSSGELMVKIYRFPTPSVPLGSDKTSWHVPE